MKLWHVWMITPEAVCADAAYGSGSNSAAMEQRGIRFVSPPPKAKNQFGDSCFTVEDFKYDEKKDIFVCPAGKTLKYLHRVKARPNQCCYGASKSECRKCELKNNCTRSPRRTLKVSIYHEALKRLRADSKTESFKKLYKTRAPGVEGIFAEAKQWHGLRRAWRRGLSKMLVQSLLIAAVLNFKRLATVFYILNAPKIAFRSMIAVILISVVRFWHKIFDVSTLKIEIANQI